MSSTSNGGFVILSSLEEVSRRTRRDKQVSVKAEQWKCLRQALMTAIGEEMTTTRVVTNDTPGVRKTNVSKTISSPVKNQEKPNTRTQQKRKDPPQPPPQKKSKPEMSVSELFNQADAAKNLFNTTVPTSPKLPQNEPMALSEALLPDGQWDPDISVSDYLPTSPFIVPADYSPPVSKKPALVSASDEWDPSADQSEDATAVDVNTRIESPTLPPSTAVYVDEWDPALPTSTDANAAAASPLKSPAQSDNWDPTGDHLPSPKGDADDDSPLKSPTQPLRDPPPTSATVQADDGWDPTGDPPSKTLSEEDWNSCMEADPKDAIVNIPSPGEDLQAEEEGVLLKSPSTDWNPTGVIDSPPRSFQGDSPPRPSQFPTSPESIPSPEKKEVPQASDGYGFLPSPILTFKEVDSPTLEPGIPSPTEVVAKEDPVSLTSPPFPPSDSLKKRKVPGQSKLTDPDLEDWNPPTGKVSPHQPDEESDNASSDEQDDGIGSMF
eukprot:TRINITY_DN33552_c0_g1_i1.p1 TRINITY_DN33552_c0_g1~~TRINITY_DN33552_c0_g1_i1.p1  ORF type:complete len:493 (+),score=130.46 TRINITY_DN33552_c0_g1_i1:37-1515(+)